MRIKLTWSGEAPLTRAGFEPEFEPGELKSIKVETIQIFKTESFWTRRFVNFEFP